MVNVLQRAVNNAEMRAVNRRSKIWLGCLGLRRSRMVARFPEKVVSDLQSDSTCLYLFCATQASCEFMMEICIVLHGCYIVWRGKHPI
uniref:Uncharacterized protein n=1 Tax=Arundo donax TaxID=35708 RepID=A0A0A8YTG8_ARUDO